MTMTENAAQDTAIDWEKAVFRRAEKRISTEQKGETVILDLTTGVYHGLNRVGNSIWRLLEEPKTLDDLRLALMEEYEVSAENCTEQVKKFLMGIEKEGLVSIVLKSNDG